MIFLPEASDFIGNPSEEAMTLSHPVNGTDTGPFLTGLCAQAKQLGIWCSVGIHEKVIFRFCYLICSQFDMILAMFLNALMLFVRFRQSPCSGKLYNTHVLINHRGDIVEAYRKIHLFDVNIANGPILMESNNTVPGTQLVAPVPTPAGRVGLGICYDLRFPEMALALRKQGAEVLTFPSAFTIKTGEAHWGMNP